MNFESKYNENINSITSISESKNYESTNNGIVEYRSILDVLIARNVVKHSFKVSEDNAYASTASRDKGDLDGNYNIALHNMQIKLMDQLQNMENQTINQMPQLLYPLRQNPGHDYPDNLVLDLCVRKRPPSPNYPHDYNMSHSYENADCYSPKSEVSDLSSTDHRDSQVSSSKMKCSRPFKAYPKDPLSMSLINTSPNTLCKDSVEAYAEFREKILSRAHANHNGTNKNMRRTQIGNMKNSDPTYWEKRKKNNEAAKRSRDARRAKEDEIAIRCAFLEQENIQLKFRLTTLESERERLQNILYHHS